MKQIGAEHQLDTLANIYYDLGDANVKAPSYLQQYEELLGHRRHAPLRLLELGVASGASLLIWRDYLPNATIVGVDVSRPPPQIHGQSRIHFIRGSQDDPEILDRAAATAGGQFDLIIDDASHIGYLTKRSFVYLFPRWLSPGGTYVIEDFGTAFRRGYPDSAPFAVPPDNDMTPTATIFASHQHGMMGVIKQLMDHMMTELAIGQPPQFAIERMTIRANVAFLQKSGQLPLPGAEADSKAMNPADQMPMIAACLRQQDLRLSALEQGLRGLVERLQPKPGLHDHLLKLRAYVIHRFRGY